MRTKICESCRRPYYKPSRMGLTQWERSRYCSKPCKGQAMIRPAEIRFWEKVEKGDSEDSCWVWIAKSKHLFGYGVLGLKKENRQVMAHRFAYELLVGPIPDGLFVLHRCDNPPCVNPDHLFLGTQKDNLDDMTQKGRRRWADNRGSRNGNAKLSDAQVEEIRSLYPACTQQQIADRFGIGQTYVSALARGKMRKKPTPILES